MITPPKKHELNFVLAGYSRRFDVEVDESIPNDHPAFDIFKQFDGLHIHPNLRSGLECAPSDIAFQAVEPMPEVVSQWQTLLKTKLIGVALIAEGTGQLWVSECNDYYVSNDVDDGFGWIGSGFDTVVDNLLEGHKIKTMLRPDEQERKVYGEIVKRGDPETHDCRHSYPTSINHDQSTIQRPGFRLTCIEALTEIGKLKREIARIEKIPEREDYFEDANPKRLKAVKQIPLTDRLLGQIREIGPDGGDDIYSLVMEYWRGTQEELYVGSISDAKLLPNLEKVWFHSVIHEHCIDLTVLTKHKKLQEVDTDYLYLSKSCDVDQAVYELKQNGVTVKISGKP